MRLAEWRRANRMTQQQVADSLGCILTTIARYESGLRMPEPDMMLRIFTLTDGAVQPNDFYSLPGSTPDREAA